MEISLVSGLVFGTIYMSTNRFIRKIKTSNTYKEFEQYCEILNIIKFIAGDLSVVLGIINTIGIITYS